jgi:hypothetical protein
VQLLVGGTSTAMVEEPTTSLGGGVYQITSTSKRNLDPDVAISVTEAGDYVVDYLLGTLTYEVDPGDPPLVSANYIPLLAVAEARSLSFNMSAAELDASVMNEAFTKLELGQATAEGTITSLALLDYDLDTGGGTTTWKAILEGRLPFLLSATIQGEVWRAWAMMPTGAQEAGNDSLYTATISWKSSARKALSGETVAFTWGSAT